MLDETDSIIVTRNSRMQYIGLSVLEACYMLDAFYRWFHLYVFSSTTVCGFDFLSYPSPAPAYRSTY